MTLLDWHKSKTYENCYEAVRKFDAFTNFKYYVKKSSLKKEWKAQRVVIQKMFGEETFLKETSWIGPFKTKKSAIKHMEDVYYHY